MTKKGNVLVITSIFIMVILVIILFIMFIFVSEVNSLLYNIKLDMYSINKSAIISVNKGITSREGFSYDKNTYKDYFEKMLITNFKLNKELKNDNGIIKSIKIVEYDIYQSGKRDKYTNTKVNDTTIHSVIEVRIKPIILESWLEDIFTFKIHEDVVLNTVII